jgi:hypothetical protein
VVIKNSVPQWTGSWRFQDRVPKLALGNQPNNQRATTDLMISVTDSDIIIANNLANGIKNHVILSSNCLSISVQPPPPFMEEGGRVKKRLYFQSPSP